MQKEMLERLRRAGADVSEEKERAELVSRTDSGVSRVICYFLSESMRVIAWDIKGGRFPELSNDIRRIGGGGRFLSAICCVKGKCEFSNSVGKSLYISAGEISMDYYIDKSGASDFHADEFLGIEVVMQVDKVITELPTLAMLKKAIKRMDMPEFATNINSVYFINAQDSTKTISQDLINYCKDGGDRELIIIKASEFGHSIGRDLVHSKIKPRTFASRSQARIAEDIHDKLTNDLGSKWTVGYFAEKYDISETSVKNYFRSIYGCGVQEYQRRVRMERAAALLSDSDLTVTETANMVGYRSVSKFREAFIAYYGTTPPEYRRNAKIDKAQETSSSDELANIKEDN